MKKQLQILIILSLAAGMIWSLVAIYEKQEQSEVKIVPAMSTESSEKWYVVYHDGASHTSTILYSKNIPHLTDKAITLMREYAVLKLGMRTNTIILSATKLGT